MEKKIHKTQRTAMILAAGFGKRLLPLTNEIPKVLLKVQGEPLIVHQINRLVQASMGPIVINLGHLGNQIKQYLGNGKAFNTDILYSHEEIPLETAGGIIKALPLLGKDPFVVVSGDIYTDYPYECLPLKPQSLAHLVLVDNPSWHAQGDFGLSEKNIVCDTTDIKYTFANIGVYSPAFFYGLPQSILPLGPLLREAIKNNKITGEHYQGLWYNVGTLTELTSLNALSC